MKIDLDLPALVDELMEAGSFTSVLTVRCDDDRHTIELLEEQVSNGAALDEMPKLLNLLIRIGVDLSRWRAWLLTREGEWHELDSEGRPRAQNPAD